MGADKDEIERKRHLRIEAFGRALTLFQKFVSEKEKWRHAAILKTAAADLGNVYWTMHEKHVRPHVSQYSGRFKMASLTEKAIFLIQPFRTDYGEPIPALNALFAFTCALTIIEEMDSDEDFGEDGVWERFGEARDTKRINGLLTELKDSHPFLYESLKRSITHHVLWLETYDRREDGAFPILHNAVFLDLLWHSLHFPVKSSNQNRT